MQSFNFVGGPLDGHVEPIPRDDLKKMSAGQTALIRRVCGKVEYIYFVKRPYGDVVRAKLKATWTRKYGLRSVEPDVVDVIEDKDTSAA